MRHLATMLLLCVSSLSFAHNCPNKMKTIDAALTSTKLAGADLAKVKALRADGEKAHTEGNE